MIHPSASLLGTLLMGMAAFAATNIDDLLILTFFFGHHAGRSGRWRIVAGQCLAIGAIVLLSLTGRIAIHFLSPRRIGLLGILPILIGVRHSFASRWGTRHSVPKQADLHRPSGRRDLCQRRRSSIRGLPALVSPIAAKASCS